MSPLTLPPAARRSLLLDWGGCYCIVLISGYNRKARVAVEERRTPACGGLAVSGPKTNAIRFASLSERYFHDVEKAVSGYVLNVLSVFSSSVK